jgi:hypothetical protein
METKKKKISFLSIIIMVISAMVGIFASNYFIESCKSRGPKIGSYEWLTEIVNEVNKNFPVMGDEETRCDEAKAIELPRLTLAYYYTLINFSRDDIDIEIFEENMKPMLLNDVRTGSHFKHYRDNNITIAYIYRDKDGIEITSFEFPPDVYK